MPKSVLVANLFFIFFKKGTDISDIYFLFFNTFYMSVQYILQN